MLRRPIPRTGELLPVVGVGTWKGFDAAPGSAAFRPLQGVLGALFESGGSVIDSSPMYGLAEAAVGELLRAPSLAGARPFLATKVWTRGREAGIRQMRQSFERLGTARVDLMQVHNLVDVDVHLATLRDWQAAGRVRHVGVTHYTESAHSELEAVLRRETLDAVQLNYSVADRAAEQRLLPLAQERGLAVLVNLPLGSGGLPRAAAPSELPGWARAELGCTSWPQLLLKFVLGHPAVTCVIPGTGNPVHMADNALAGTGPMPDPAMRRRIAAAWAALA